MVIEHEPGDLTCTVGGDVPFGELQRVLAEGGQMLALDPPGAATMTVREAFDAAAFGPRAHRHGRPRDLVLGMTVRLADGTVARVGGRVVKTVAGYDLPKLFTGAGGRLGEILELTLRLHPLPAEVPATIERLRAAGATEIVGRYARGLLFADVQIACLTPNIQREALERRVVESYAG